VRIAQMSGAKFGNVYQPLSVCISSESLVRNGSSAYLHEDKTASVKLFNLAMMNYVKNFGARLK